jgi:N-acetylneuraminic acid mutarotase
MAAPSSRQLDTGKMYEPVAGIWTSMASFSKRNNHRAVWIGSKMMVWGGVDPSGAALNTGGLFDPVTGFWQATTLAGAPTARGLHSMIWTGSRVLVWGGNIREGARYDPQANSWTPMAAGPEGPTSRRDNGTIWTGSHLIVWGGVEPFPTYAVLNSGSRYDPITDSWNRTSRESNVPEPRYTFTMVWAGNRMVIWGGYKDTGETFNSGGRYDPIADTWLPTSTVFSPPPYAGAKAVWAGSKVFLVEWVWGASYTYNAFLYDPAADTWAAASTFHQIIPRDECPMIWTGSEVILWGGLALNNAATLDTGGAYDPATDSWRTISQSQNPSPRRYHSAVWTGSEMLFWGGLGVSGYTFNDGGRYNPATDEWSALAGANPPSPRAGHVAIWTGTEMIIWGGTTDTNERLNTGAHYDPVAQQWTPTTLVGAPPALPVSAFWSGQFMLLYEGHQIGGVYAPQQVDGDSDADGYPACSGDCDDGDPAVHPGAFEICNGRDDDCDGTLDNGFPDADEDGVAACGGDCNDVDATIRPGLPEACDDQDNNCNGLVDEGYPDLDNDGYAGCGGDCDDSRAPVHPGMPEICDGLDNDCSGGVDNIDQDGDGYWGCGGDDCDDANPAVHPGAPEVCNGIDDNCFLGIDESPDADSDGWTVCLGDCNDSNPAIHPFAPDACNGVDDDCNGVDGLDADGDTHTPCADDCDDQDASVWAPAVEVTGLSVAPSFPTQVSWDSQAALAGPQTTYFLASGSVGPATGINYAISECLFSSADNSMQDARPSPPPGTAFWFLAAAANSCGLGTYGSSSGGGERAIANCP